MIKAAYNVHEEKKKARGTKENPPTRCYWLWKKCCRAKSDCHVTKAAAASTIFHPRSCISTKRFQTRLPLWAVTDCCWLLVSGFITCGWFFLFAFSFLCNKKVSCIVPAHCFAACSLLSTSPRLAIIVEAKSGAGRRRKNRENPLHETVEHLFAQLIREPLLIVCVSSNTIKHLFRSRFFFPQSEKKCFVPFCYQSTAFQIISCLVFEVNALMEILLVELLSCAGIWRKWWLIRFRPVDGAIGEWTLSDSKRNNPGISRSNKDLRNIESSA